ncbi:MAG: hypothetical protein F6K40_37215 [Okeania sp. SIO3I5]|uniref:hypothetical protein n=1 Tax=Okeania sp. SIO3I5 TaxID=2607805 RepID=UPI0013BE2BB4|nr:hypothetical protein [Okeania sp. SIO3I5]NEQ41535.1 hypothetical protein [Okeania sp. SIO3I5]
MSESANDVLEKYKLDKRYKFITAMVLSGILLIFIFLLVYVAIPVAIQQVLIAIVGMILLATLDAFKRCLEEQTMYQPFTIIDNRNIENNTVYNTSYERQNLAEAASEIQELLDQLSKTYRTETQKEKIELAVEVADEVNQNSTLKSRVITALKAGGRESLKQSIKSPISNIIVAALEALLLDFSQSTADNNEQD